LQQLSQQISTGDILLTPTLTITQVIREEYDPPQNQAADRLNLDMTVNFLAQVASQDDLRALAKGVLDANTPEGFHSIPDTIVIELLTEPENVSDVRVSWRMRVTQQIQADLEESKATSLIRGLTSSKAIEKLRAYLPLESTPSIRMTPQWWPRLPLLPFRINLEAR
jgi:hypothetical protein